MQKPTLPEFMNMKALLCLMMSDIQIFLIKEEDQTTDKDKLFTADEIRAQLDATLMKTVNMLNMLNIDIDSNLKSRLHGN